MKTSFPDIEINYLNLLPKNKSALILDFGCGSGRLIRFLQELGYTNIEGADIDKELLLNVTTELNVKTHLVTEEFLNSLDNTYDLIIAKDVIYYYNYNTLIPCLNNLRKGLKKDGLFICEIFNGAVYTGPYIKYKDFDIQLILTEHSLKNLIIKAGFIIIKLSGNKRQVKGVKSFIFMLIQSWWKFKLKSIYFMERGIDEQNPTIYDRKIILLAKNI